MAEFNNILLIDDNPMDNIVNEFTISSMKLGNRIFQFENAIDALNYLKDVQAEGQNIIFLDINMPVMNGFQFLEKFEELRPETKNAYKIVMLTSSNNPLDIENAKNNMRIVEYIE